MADVPAMLYQEAIVYLSHYYTSPYTSVTTTALKKKVLKSLLAMSYTAPATLEYKVVWNCIFQRKVATAAFVSSMIAFLQSTTLQHLILRKIDNPDYPLCSFLNSFRLAVLRMQHPDQHPYQLSQMKYLLAMRNTTVEGTVHS